MGELHAPFLQLHTPSHVRLCSLVRGPFLRKQSTVSGPRCPFAFLCLPPPSPGSTEVGRHHPTTKTRPCCRGGFKLKFKRNDSPYGQ